MTNKYITNHEGDTINVSIEKSDQSGMPTIVIDVNGQKIGLSFRQLNEVGLTILTPEKKATFQGAKQVFVCSSCGVWYGAFKKCPVCQSEDKMETWVTIVE